MTQIIQVPEIARGLLHAKTVLEQGGWIQGMEDGGGGRSFFGRGHCLLGALRVASDETGISFRLLRLAVYRVLRQRREFHSFTPEHAIMAFNDSLPLLWCGGSPPPPIVKVLDDAVIAQMRRVAR